MNYTFFAVAAYIFMRAFETIFSDQKNKHWYKTAIKVIGWVVLYGAVAALISFYIKAPLLGYDPR